jgi:hypothetical protein
VPDRKRIMALGRLKRGVDGFNQHEAGVLEYKA